MKMPNQIHNILKISDEDEESEENENQQGTERIRQTGGMGMKIIKKDAKDF